MTEAAAPIRTRGAAGTRWLGKLEGKISWILLGLAGLLLPLLDDSYIGTIATRAYIYWVLSAGLNLVVGYAGQIAIGWVSMLTLAPTPRRRSPPAASARSGTPISRCWRAAP